MVMWERPGVIVMVAGLMCGLASCQTGARTSAAETGGGGSKSAATGGTKVSAEKAEAAPSAGNVGGVSDYKPRDLRDALAMLDKGHHDKMKLSWWVGTPLRSVDGEFKTFYKDMGTSQKALAEELEGWAKAHHMDLTYHYGDDPFGRAQKIMEDRQEKVVRGDDKENFSRDMLVEEYQDYEFTISLIQALLPAVHDAGLKEYLEKSLHEHEAGSGEIMGFLKRYQLGR